MADQLQHLVGGQHLGLEVELLLELVVVYPRVAGGEDEQRPALRLFEGQGLGYPRAIDAQGLGRKLHRGAGDRELYDAVLHAELTEIRAPSLNGHVYFFLSSYLQNHSSRSSVPLPWAIARLSVSSTSSMS